MTTFPWLGGRVSLDLCNTRLGEKEYLLAPEDLARWMTEAGLEACSASPSRADLDAVTFLRGQLRGALLERDTTLVAQVVGQWLERVPGRLLVDPATFRPRFCPAGNTCRSHLVPVALDALDIAVSSLFRVHRCAAGPCEVIYLDESRNQSRRWCSMERCGARAKARAYYRRRRLGQ